MGFCIGGPFIWNLLKRAPNRVAAAVLAQPVGWRPEMRDPKYPGVFWRAWGGTLIAKRPEITLQTTDQFATKITEDQPGLRLYPRRAISCAAAKTRSWCSRTMFPRTLTTLRWKALCWHRKPK